MPISEQHSASWRCRDNKTPPKFVGESSCMGLLKSLIEAVSHRACTVLVLGESGTGKEMIARHIHAASNRVDKPFIPVDCTTLRDSLLESQLFGHEKGAFTGADQATLGFLRAADGGTVLLDEVGELAPQVQAKLLRFLQERAVVPLGGVDPIPVDVRVIAATHRDLKAMVDRGEFRQDLYYRLNVVTLNLPPLRQRREDILLLADHFMSQLADMYGDSVKTIAPQAVEALQSYNWPGNVRELANAIEHGYVLSDDDKIRLDDMPESIRLVAPAQAVVNDGQIVPLETAERSLIARALRASDGHQARAAEMLQIERRRLYRKIRRYGLQAFVNTRRG